MDETTYMSEKKKPYSPNRSCERCRALKIRCIPEDSIKCQRCCRLHVDCVYALPAKRKPRKRTDAKVAELEKEVRALSSILRKNQSAVTPSSSTSDPVDTDLTDGLSVKPMINGSNSPDDTLSTRFSKSLSGRIRNPSEKVTISQFDVINAGLLTHDLATEIFHIFRDQYLPLFPIVSFPSGTTADEVRATRPFLYHAILAAAAGCTDLETNQMLNKNITSAIAEFGMVQGMKSLDLLQGILVSTAWHFPESSFDHLKYHQYAHLAAGMTSYVGIERKSRERQYPSKQTQLLNRPEEERPVNQAEEEKLLDRQRSLLACYLLCSGICRSLHRPTIVPYTNWMNQCLENLQNSQFAAETDKTLVLLVRMQKVMTESSTALGLDDTDVFVDLAEPRVQRTLTFYDSELESWFQLLEQPHPPATLKFLFFTNRVSLHEISMYLDHDQDDFHAPFTLERIGRPAQRRGAVTPAHIESLSICWSAGVEALEAFLATPVEILRCNPVFIFVRMIYCATVLLKLSESATISDNPTPLFAKADRETVTRLLSRLIELLYQPAIAEWCVLAAKFGTGLERMLAWFNRPAVATAEEQLTDDLLQPLKDMALERPLESNPDSKDICFDNTMNSTDVNSRGPVLPQDVLMFSHPSHDGSLGGLEDFDFMPWDDLDWNIVSEPTYDLASEFNLFDVGSLEFAAGGSQDLSHPSK